MDYNFDELKEHSEQDVTNLDGQGINLMCKNYEPWADMMLLGGAGDPGSEGFPFNIEEIESVQVSISSGQES
jgi:hypothetical protein